jgi:hypothetical protein
VSDENAVLYAMFPRETEAFYKPAPATAGAPAPAPASSPAPTAVTAMAPSPAPAPLAKRMGSRMVLTLNQKRYEAMVEEID